MKYKKIMELKDTFFLDFLVCLAFFHAAGDALTSHCGMAFVVAGCVVAILVACEPVASAPTPWPAPDPVADASQQASVRGRFCLTS